MAISGTQPTLALSLLTQKFEETELIYQRCQNILDRVPQSFTLSEKVETLDLQQSLSHLRSKIISCIRYIDSIEAIHCLFNLLKTNHDERTQVDVMSQLSQRMGRRNKVYEAGQQDPEAVDFIRQRLQDCPGDDWARESLFCLENELT